MEKQSYKVSHKDAYISIELIESLIKQSTVPKDMIEEEYSELWFNTYNGSGTIIFQNNVVYEGNVRFGILDSAEGGKSTIVFADGTKYEGEIKNNQITGKGTYTFPSGSTFSGEIYNGLRNGYGVYQSPEGIKYEGEWKYGLKHGVGKMIKGNMTYEGDWKDGIIEGFGKIKWQSGNLYEGEFKNNKINGNGYMIWYDSGEKYTGQWQDNLQHGLGIHIWYEAKGEQKYLRNRYVGQWNKGFRHGYGVFFYSNGSKYEGQWDCNYKDGFGVFTYHDGSQYVGKFKNDRMVESNPNGILQMAIAASKLPEVKPVANQNRNNRGGVGTVASVGERRHQGGGSIVASQLEVIQENVKPPSSNENSNNVPGSRPVQGNQPGTINPIVPEESPGIPKSQNIASSKTIKEGEANQFKTMIDITDIIETEPDIENSLKEIENILLRNLTDIKHWYKIALGKENIRELDYLNQSTMQGGNDVSKIGGNALIALQKVETNANPMTPEEKEKAGQNISVMEGIYSNDLGFCLEMKDLWKLFRETGIASVDFTLAQFNRIFFRGAKNYIEMFMLSEEIEPKRIYSYIYLMITKAKDEYNGRYKKYLDFFKQQPKDSNAVDTGNETDKKQNEQNQNELNYHVPELEVQFDFHNKHQIILLRQFYEVIVRAAYIKFFNVNLPLHLKLKNLFQTYMNLRTSKTKFKKNTTTHLESSFSNNSVIFDAKTTKNLEASMDSFRLMYENILRPLFKKLYLKSTSIPKKYDMTITHRFFYKTIILRSQILKDMFREKRKYIELITYFHKDKKILSIESMAGSKSKESFEYIENLMDCEFIFFEFCEIAFFLSRKYLSVNNLQDNKKNILDLINHMWDLVKLENGVIKKHGKTKYEFPLLPHHTALEQLIDRRIAMEREEERRRREEKRWKRERELMKIEDVNVYTPEEEDMEEENSNESNDSIN